MTGVQTCALPIYPRNWQSRHPEAFAKLEAIRTEISHLAEELNLPAENLIAPEVIRRAVWFKPKNLTALEQIFDENRVRSWQRDHVRKLIAQTLELD